MSLGTSFRVENGPASLPFQLVLSHRAVVVSGAASRIQNHIVVVANSAPAEVDPGMNGARAAAAAIVDGSTTQLGFGFT